MKSKLPFLIWLICIVILVVGADVRMRISDYPTITVVTNNTWRMQWADPGVTNYGMTYVNLTNQLFSQMREQSNNFAIVRATNVVEVVKVLSPTSQQTNYLFSFSTNGSVQVIYTANTNANVTLTNIIIGSRRFLIMDALTSSVTAQLKLPANVVTNLNLNLFTTNGTIREYELVPIGGTDPTNVFVRGNETFIR